MISSLLIPDWPVPANVSAGSSTRSGGMSDAPYNALNLADHVGDFPHHVAENRRIFQHLAELPMKPCWLDQVHGTRVLNLNQPLPSDRRADASYSSAPGQVCVVMTADCLPVLFCTRDGDEVAAAHAGWRGLCDGILENTLSNFQTPKLQIMAWLGPAIGPKKFEVGPEVRERFIRKHPEAVLAFIPKGKQYLADIYLLARQRLQAAGLVQIYGGEHCTFSETDTFFSYRREQTTGRMASVIWFR